MRAERPGPPVKPLTELSLRVSGARLEPEQNVVRLHAENMIGGPLPLLDQREPVSELL